MRIIKWIKSGYHFIMYLIQYIIFMAGLFVFGRLDSVFPKFSEAAFSRVILPLGYEAFESGIQAVTQWTPEENIEGLKDIRELQNEILKKIEELKEK